MDVASLSVEQRAEWDRIVDRVMAKARGEIEAAALLVVTKADPQLFGQTEFQLRDMMHRLGVSVLDAALDERKKKGYQGSSATCPHCREAARFVGYRRKKVTSLVGAIVYERAYYHCRHCHEGWFPTVEAFGLTETLTTAVRKW